MSARRIVVILASVVAWVAVEFHEGDDLLSGPKHAPGAEYHRRREAIPSNQSPCSGTPDAAMELDVFDVPVGAVASAAAIAVFDL
jgi:hypothetical protein